MRLYEITNERRYEVLVKGPWGSTDVVSIDAVNVIDAFLKVWLRYDFDGDDYMKEYDKAWQDHKNDSPNQFLQRLYKEWSWSDFVKIAVLYNSIPVFSTFDLKDLDLKTKTIK